MALESLRHVVVLPVSPERLYAAWIDADAHGELTGGAATSEPRVGGAYSAWDGYITGQHVELVPGERIVQKWRSTEFPDDAGDSHLEIHLRDVPGGTEVTLIHTDIPEGQAEQYESGWVEHYFAPMRKYFANEAAAKSTTPKKKAARAKKPVVKAVTKKAAPKAKPAKKKAAAKKTTAVTKQKHAKKKKPTAKKTAAKKKPAKRKRR